MQGTDRSYEVPGVTAQGGRTIGLDELAADRTDKELTQRLNGQQLNASERIAEHTGNTDWVTNLGDHEVFTVTDRDGVKFQCETFGTTQVQLYARTPADFEHAESVLAWITPDQAEAFAHDLLHVARLARAGRIQAS